MSKSNSGGIKRGQTISFRVPSDTPDHLLKHLQNLRETERRNFSSKIADYVLQGVGNSYERKRESITIPLPNKLSKAQRDWMKHEHSEALMGSILYHLLSDPVRATALLGSLNSSSSNIDEALYLQEEVVTNEEKVNDVNHPVTDNDETAATAEHGTTIDDLDSFDWSKAKQEQPNDVEAVEEKEEDLEDFLGDFLAEMNK